MLTGKETCDYCIDNFRAGIEDQNKSFSAMDIKAGIFMSSLVVVATFLLSNILDLHMTTQPKDCVIIINILVGLWSVLVIINLVFGFITLRGRPLDSGVFDDEQLKDLEDDGLNVRHKIHIRLVKAYGHNEQEYHNKSRYFSYTQKLWRVSLLTALIIMIILVATGL